MAKKLFQRFMPDPSRLRENRSLNFLGEHMFDPNLWHLNRRTAAMAFFVGIFCAFLPIPFQMLLAAVLAFLLRCNLPLSVALVWITNPFTMPVIFYFTYKVGCYILQTPVSPLGFEASLEWLKTELSRIWLPLYLGSVITGLIAGALSYISIRLFWRWHIIRNWRERRKRRKLFLN
ncbi:DUF2062 domain-containing protein [Kistimonas scapharcae]|uniref:DUF2062 domain-containing protein n=1 Tax=Kistimonas scapharcae TaxID=1036133 RepID=A0ABP8V873_9GAMM